MIDILKIVFDKFEKIPKKAVFTWVILILLFVLAIFPYLDSNLFYPNRIKNRLEILNMVTKLDINKIENNESLKIEYDNILLEIKDSSKNYINNVFDSKDNGSRLWKFISGASLFWIFAVIFLFYKEKNVLQTKKTILVNKIGGLIMLILISLFFGWIFSIIPIIGNPWVNYIGAPIILLVILILLLYKPSKKF